MKYIFTTDNIMKKVLTIIFIFFPLFMFSQPLNINLSVKWEKVENVFYRDSLCDTPFLCITYENNTDQNIYFHKVCNSLTGFPSLPIPGLLEYSRDEYLNPNYLKRAKSYINFSEDSFYVDMGGQGLYEEGWEIMPLCSDINKERTTHPINGEIRNINSLKGNVDPDLFPSLLDSAQILNSYKEQFVFLRPKEKHVDVFNLYAFYLIGGDFTFAISQYYKPNIISVRLEGIEIGEKELPVFIDRYLLYKGDFISNRLRLKFKGVIH